MRRNSGERMSQTTRFESWRRRVSPHTRYLADLLLERALPAFEAQGFQRLAEYGRKGVSYTGLIPLQRQSGEYWPTVQLRFHDAGRPAFYVEAAALPPICNGYVGTGFVNIDRGQALVTEGRASFYLRRRNRGAMNQFGYAWFALLPRAKLRREVNVLLERLPVLFRAFDAGELAIHDSAKPLPEWIGLVLSRERHFQGAESAG
jgi:hypothetical protein